jgi:hypothetical protein
LLEAPEDPRKTGAPPKERVKTNSGSVGDIGPGLKSTIVAADTQEQRVNEAATAANEIILDCIRTNL